MQNAHGKEIDLLRVTVKVPGKRPPRAVAPAGPSPAAPASSGINGLTKESAAAEATGTGTEDVSRLSIVSQMSRRRFLRATKDWMAS